MILPPRRQKIAGPAVEAHTVDKIRRTLGGLQIVLAARVIGIANATIAIAVIYPVLAPDLALAHMNALFYREEPLIFCIHEARHEALRAITVTDHARNQP